MPTPKPMKREMAVNAEESLRAREESYRALVDGLPDIIMRFDRSGRHLFVSHNVNEVVELEAAGFIGKTHRELGFPEEQCRLWKDAIERVFATGLPVGTEFAFVGTRGPAIFDWRLVPEFGPGGSVASVLTISRDVTRVRHAERAYQALFHEMMDGFALHEIIRDADGRPVDFKFLAINPAFERMTHFSASRVVGRTLRQVLSEEELHWLETYLYVAQSGAPTQYVSYSKTLDRFFEVKSYDAGPNQYACIFTDITERRRTENALRASEAKYRDLFEQSRDAISLSAPDGALLDCNQAWLDLLGYSRAETVGLNVRDVYATPRDRDDFLRRIAEAGFISDEVRYRRKDGTMVLCQRSVTARRDAEGGVVSFQAISRDVTAQREAEDALKHSEALFRSMFETSHAGIVIFDTATGRFVDANASYVHILGYTLEELRKLTVQDVTHPDDWAVQQPMIAGLREGSRSGYQVEKRYFRKDGAMRTVLVAASMLPLGDAEMPPTLASVLDITERKQDEEELLRSREELRMLASRIEEIREAERTGIARELHDQVGQALTALKMDLDRLRATSQGDSFDRSLVEGMTGLVDQTADDVRRLSSELRPGLLDDFGLVSAIEWQLTDFEERSGIRCGLNADIADSLLDRPRTTALFRVVQELLTNVARHADATEVLVSIGVDGGVLRVSVADNGRGIARRRVEDPLSLGVIGMRERILPFAGTLTYELRQPHGTVAVVTLPLPAE